MNVSFGELSEVGLDRVRSDLAWSTRLVQVRLHSHKLGKARLE